ncbi:MAG: flagellar hook assembly protein FlgD [Planctomycetota bacterium]|jgi:flagellar basal-body rod modification protein FlgD
MEIQGTSASDSSLSLSSSLQATGSQELDKDAFMQLLVAQMQNQDPLEPQSNEEFVAQLANFSTLEQMELMNANLETMAVLDQSNALLSQLSESSNLIGKEVKWDDLETGAAGSGIVSSVKLQDGLTLLEVNGQEIPLFTVTEVLEPEQAAADSDEDADSDEVDGTDGEGESEDSDA